MADRPRIEDSDLGDIDVEHRGAPVGRRVVLGMLGLGALGVLRGAGAADLASRVMRPITERDPTGLSSYLPTSGRFRYYSVVGHSPHRSPAEWRLTVKGLVAKPIVLTLDDLGSLPQTRLVRDFQCVTGWRVPEVQWEGVALSEVLGAAGGVTAGAAALTFRSFDGVYDESLSLDQAMRPDSIVAHTLEGKPVTTAHGGPVRLYVAPMYGYKSLKWLEEITVDSAVAPGYWERLGYSVDGFIGKSNGRDDPAA